MNYIKHLTSFLQNVKSDSRLNPNHISLYLSLFHFWNQNLFKNPVLINRAQILVLCKIGSQHTYYKCLKELDLFGYIRYLPSHNPSKGCLVYLCNFDITQLVSPNSCKNDISIAANLQQHDCSDISNDEKFENDSCKNSITIAADLHKYSCKNDITIAAKMQPSINNINNINNKTYCGEKPQYQKTENQDSNFLNQNSEMENTAKRKKVAPKKEKVDIPPSLEQVKSFFKVQEYPELEAHKFFNHFQSNGWKVGGKSPMKDWHAAARNWMLNFNKFNPQLKTKSTTLNQKKNYGEPL